MKNPIDESIVYMLVENQSYSQSKVTRKKLIITL